MANDPTQPRIDPAANIEAHDAWFRSKVQEAVDDSRPAMTNEEVKTRFAARRIAAILAEHQG